MLYSFVCCFKILRPEFYFTMMVQDFHFLVIQFLSYKQSSLYLLVLTVIISRVLLHAPQPPWKMSKVEKQNSYIPTIWLQQFSFQSQSGGMDAWIPLSLCPPFQSFRSLMKKLAGFSSPQFLTVRICISLTFFVMSFSALYFL